MHLKKKFHITYIKIQNKLKLFLKDGILYLRGGKREVRNIRIGKNTSNNKKTGLYIRVSTNVQFEEGYSVGAQTEKLEKYCNYQEIDNYDLYIDGGYSGSNLNRPEMKRLIKEIQEGKVESVVVVKLDRLSRSQKDTIYLLEDVFEANGVGFISLNENFDTTTPYGKAMVGILSVFAQYERENIRERTQMGITERIKPENGEGRNHHLVMTIITVMTFLCQIKMQKQSERFLNYIRKAIPRMHWQRCLI